MVDDYETYDHHLQARVRELRARLPLVTHETLVTMALTEDWEVWTPLLVCCPNGHGHETAHMKYDNSCNAWDYADEDKLYCPVCGADMEDATL